MQHLTVHTAFNGELYVIEDLKEVVKEFSKNEMRVFRIIVSNGISEEKEAKEKCIEQMILEDGTCLSPDTVWRHIRHLTRRNLFAVTEIKTGYRRFHVLALTDKGHMIYKLVYKKNAPTQEYMTVLQNHGSLPHGYLIKDVKHVLDEKRIFTEVTTGRKENSIRIPGGGICIPDVIAYENGKPSLLFEVECGTHHQRDIEAKYNKLALVTKNILVVGKSRPTVSGILKQQIEQWIEHVGRTNLLNKGIKVYLTSILDLQKGKWTYMYDMLGDKPKCCFEKEVEDGDEGYFD